MNQNQSKVNGPCTVGAARRNLYGCINSTGSRDVDWRRSETPASSVDRSSVPTPQKAMQALWATQVVIERAVSISASGSWLSSASTTAPALPETYPPPVVGSHPSFPE